jgi:hypothetical protein
MNYSMLDEIWDDYKYTDADGKSSPQPSSSMKDSGFSNSSSRNPLYGGDKKRDSKELHNKYRDSPSQVHIEEFKPVSDTIPPVSPVKNGTNNQYVQDHPSISNPSDVNTYNHMPYNGNTVYTPTQTYMNHNNSSSNDCMTHLEHVRRCRYCYEQMKKEFELDIDKRGNGTSLSDYVSSIDINTVVLVVGGIAAGVLLADLLFSGGKRRR